MQLKFLVMKALYADGWGSGSGWHAGLQLNSNVQLISVQLNSAQLSSFPFNSLARRINSSGHLHKYKT